MQKFLLAIKKFCKQICHFKKSSSVHFKTIFYFKQVRNRKMFDLPSKVDFHLPLLKGVEVMMGMPILGCCFEALIDLRIGAAVELLGMFVLF